MQLILADCQFPDIENQVKAYQLFVESWENGEMAKSDKTETFEMLFRVHAPGEGRVVNQITIRISSIILRPGELNLAFILNLLP